MIPSSFARLVNVMIYRTGDRYYLGKGIKVFVIQLFFHSIANMRAAMPILGIMGTFVGAGGIYLTYFDMLDNINIMVYLWNYFYLFTFYTPAFLILVASVNVARRGRSRYRLALRKVISARNVANLASGATFGVLFCLFLAIFTAVKSSFGELLGFRHDVIQANIDQWLFFGTDPWRFLFHYFNTPAALKIIDLNYSVLWGYYVFLPIIISAYLDRRSEWRIRYISCILLTWIIVGTVAASLFISAGPVYYGLVTGDEARFGPQLTALAALGESKATAYHTYLWEAYISASRGVGSGISAFPSVHVSLTVVNALFIFEKNRQLGIAAFIYTGFVWVSSVYLAWHYAIDGLVGGILVTLIYYVLRSCLSKQTHSPRI